MIIRSTKLDLTAEPFLLVLLKRVLCSRCRLSAQNLLRSDALRFLIFSFFSEDFYTFFSQTKLKINNYGKSICLHFN